MVVAFLRAKHTHISIMDQQRFLIEYAQQHDLDITRFEIDNSTEAQELESRDEFMSFLQSLKEDNTTVLTYDNISLSRKVGELTKIFQCMLKRSITLHIAQKDLIIDKNFPTLMLLEVLVAQRAENKKIIQTSKHLGRPEGSLSKSKFDKYQDAIIGYLISKVPVSTIAKNLQLSRSSLKDYINSRHLRDIAEIKNKETGLTLNQNHIALPQAKCAMIEKPQEGTQ